MQAVMASDFAFAQVGLYKSILVDLQREGACLKVPA
jgi:hypothetical protein